MISQDSNNRPSGSPAILCDAGIPIVGRTSTTGVYEILKVNADGSLAGFPVNVANADAPYSDNPSSYPLNPVGLHGVGQLIAYENINFAAISEGLYRISPYYQVDCTAGATVSFVIVQIGTAADGYLNTLTIGTDSYNPNGAQIIGIAGFFYNVPLQTFGSGTFSMTANQVSQDLFLAAGTYRVAVIVETALTNIFATSYIGVQQFLKIA